MNLPRDWCAVSSTKSVLARANATVIKNLNLIECDLGSDIVTSVPLRHHDQGNLKKKAFNLGFAYSF